MNTDDFEQQLRRQPLRQPPAAWRDEILTTAQAHLRHEAPAREPGLLELWRSLFARIPLAWGAVAAVWAVIIGTNLLMSGPSVTVMAGPAKAAPQEKMTLWSVQRAEMSLLADHLTEPAARAPRPPATPPAPRSDRRREEGFGELQTRLTLTAIA